MIFIESMQFMKSSLDVLVLNLSDNDFIYFIIRCRTHLEWLTHPITENGYTRFIRFNKISHHQLQDALRMAYHPITQNKYIHFRRFDSWWWWLIMSKRHNKRISDGVGKPFSVLPVAGDDLLCRNAWNECNHSQWWSV